MKPSCIEAYYEVVRKLRETIKVDATMLKSMMYTTILNRRLRFIPITPIRTNFSLTLL